MGKIQLIITSSITITHSPESRQGSSGHGKFTIELEEGTYSTKQKLEENQEINSA